jgi:hypothetical protein
MMKTDTPNQPKRIHYLGATHGSTVACGKLADVDWLSVPGVAWTNDRTAVTCKTCRERTR